MLASLCLYLFVFQCLYFFQDYYDKITVEEIPKLPNVISNKLCDILEQVYTIISIQQTNMQERQDICSYINNLIFMKTKGNYIFLNIIIKNISININ